MKIKFSFYTIILYSYVFHLYCLLNKYLEADNNFGITSPL